MKSIIYKGQKYVLAAALKTAAEVHALAAALDSYKLGQQSDPVELDMKDGKFTINKSFRNFGYFESRQDEEDDDYPNFTGYDEVIKKLKAKFEDVNIDANAEEKCWFTVTLSGNYDASMDAVPLGEKLITFFTPDDNKQFIELLKTKFGEFETKFGKIVNDNYAKIKTDSKDLKFLDLYLPFFHLNSGGHLSLIKFEMHFRIYKEGKYSNAAKYEIWLRRGENIITDKKGSAVKLTSDMALDLIVKFLKITSTFLKQSATDLTAKGFKKQKDGGWKL